MSILTLLYGTGNPAKLDSMRKMLAVTGVEPFYIVEKPHEKRVEGFPLDSVSVEIRSGMYYYDIPPYPGEKLADEQNGFTDFFANVLNNYKELLV